VKPVIEGCTDASRLKEWSLVARDVDDAQFVALLCGDPTLL